MKYAILNKKREVINLVEWDGKSKFEVDGELVKVGNKPGVSMGHIEKDGEFIDPEAEKAKKSEK